MKIKLDHIAILTTSLEKSFSEIPSQFMLQKIEEQPTEGTREQYITTSNENYPSILLLEAIQPGPYQRALEKRGPGLHHLGLVTNNFDEAINCLSKAGLLLHPISEKIYSRNIAWMYRPGVPFLIELYLSSSETVFSINKTIIEVPPTISDDLETISFIPETTFRPIKGRFIKISMANNALTLYPEGI